MSRHSFDPEVAQAVGVNAAVIYQNIVWWAEKNAANERHIHDGRVWTYNSVGAFETLFPYLSTSQIRTALEKLVEAGLLVTGNFNKSPYDRTKWYSPKEDFHLSKIANEFARNDKPIPDSKPVYKPDNSQPLEASFDLWWEAYPRKEAKGSARKAYEKAIKKVAPDSLLKLTNAFAFDKETRFIPHPATWLNAERWIEAQIEPDATPRMSNEEVRMMFWTKNRYWNSDWGPRPDKRATA